MLASRPSTSPAVSTPPHLSPPQISSRRRPPGAFSSSCAVAAPRVGPPALLRSYLGSLARPPGSLLPAQMCPRCRLLFLLPHPTTHLSSPFPQVVVDEVYPALLWVTVASTPRPPSASADHPGVFQVRPPLALVRSPPSSLSRATTTTRFTSTVPFCLCLAGAGASFVGDAATPKLPTTSSVTASVVIFSL